MSLDISVSVSFRIHVKSVWYGYETFPVKCAIHDTTSEYELITIIDIYYYKQLIALLGIVRLISVL